MKKPVFKLVALSAITPNANNNREAQLYFPKRGEEDERTIEERAAEEGRNLIAADLLTMPPVQLLDDKGELIPIDGNRRFLAVDAAALIDKLDRTELKLPAMVYSDMTDSERMELEISANMHGLKPGPWAQSQFVRRLTRQGKKQDDIASRLNCTVGYVSRLSILAAMPEWVYQLGIEGKVSPNLVWDLYDSIKEKKQGKRLDLTVAKLESERAKLEAGEADKEAFGLKSRTTKLTEEIRERVERASAVNKYSTAYANTEAAIKMLPADKQAEFKTRLGKLVAPSDEKHADNAGKTYVERHETASKALETLLADVKASATNGAPQPKGADSNGIKPGSEGNAGANNQGTPATPPPATPPAEPIKEGSNITARGTELERILAATEAHCGVMLGILTNDRNNGVRIEQALNHLKQFIGKMGFHDLLKPAK